MRELRDFYNPNMTAAINGHEYEVPAPSARDGLRLRSIMSDPAKANNIDDLAEIHKIFRGTAFDDELPVGGVWDELWANDVTWPEAIHLGVTAVLYYGIGEKAAAAYWESAGKGITADPQRAAVENEPKGPTPKNMPKKKPNS